ncbi:hypothetical protein V2J09_010705 [Rumex salicifolius]
MARQKQVVEGLFMEEEDASKIRKRGCSPSSPSSSSILHNYRFKKAVLVGKRGRGSTTPVPSWRVVSSRSPSISLRMAANPEPPRSQLGRSKAGQITQPVSARKLAATLWELNKIPVAAPPPSGRRRRVDSSVSGSLPPHLSDPSHSPRSDRSGTRIQRRLQSSSVCRRQSRNAIDVGVLDSISNASFMETETRSRHQSQTHGCSTPGFKNHLKDVSNTLTTSKELLKIISRMWGQQNDRSSTSMSLISALHTELERARLQVNQMVKEERKDQNEISYLVRRFAEEKAAWKNKEKQTINAAIESIAGELEVERKLRRRVESLNKKLRKELAETKSYNSASDQLTDDIEALLSYERGKEKSYHASINHGSPGFSPSEEEGEVEDEVIEDDSAKESDLHLQEINTNSNREEHHRVINGGGRGLRRSNSLLRSVSNGIDCSQSGGRLCEFEKQTHRRSCGDDLQRYKTVKGLRDKILCGSNSRLEDGGVDFKNTRRASSSSRR